jgi:endonuclease-8
MIPSSPSARRIGEYPDRTATIAEVLLDQHVACGVGNVFRSEVLWACELSPFATIESLEPVDCVHVVNAAVRMLRANLQPGNRVTVTSATGGLAVYGRNGQRCERCGDTVHVKKVGEHARPLFWCPGCQVVHQPIVVKSLDPAEREMDPHPAAAKYLADLPWRKTSLAG